MVQTVQRVCVFCVNLLAVFFLSNSLDLYPVDFVWWLCAVCAPNNALIVVLLICQRAEVWW